MDLQEKGQDPEKDRHAHDQELQVQEVQGPSVLQDVAARRNSSGECCLDSVGLDRLKCKLDLGNGL